MQERMEAEAQHQGMICSTGCGETCCGADPSDLSPPTPPTAPPSTAGSSPVSLHGCFHFLYHSFAFHADPEAPPQAPNSSRELAIKARDASRTLQSLSSEARGNLLHQIADAIEGNQDIIMQENEKDCQVQIFTSHISEHTCQSKSDRICVEKYCLSLHPVSI